MKTTLLLLMFSLFGLEKTHAQLSVVDSQTAVQLVQKLTGAGVVVLNPVLTCPGMSEGIFKVTGTSNLGLDSGIILTSGRVTTQGNILGVDGPRNNPGSGPSAFSRGDTTDRDLKTLVPALSLRDVCKLEFDFVPNGRTVSFDYVFGSTEYQTFSCSRYNDVFGFFISGPGYAVPTNIATIPGTNIPVALNSTTDTNLNRPVIDTNCTNMGFGSPFGNFYVDNSLGMTVTYWGFTKIFRATASLIPCQTYHLKMAIADCSDDILDSGVFLKAGSFSSDSIAQSIVWDTTFCYQKTFPALPLVARSGYSAQRWNDGDTNRIHQVHQPGIYWVKYTDCQVVVDTFNVSALPEPDAFSLGADTAICAGNTSLVLHAPAGGYQNLWQDSTKGEAMKVLQPGRYFLTVRNDYCITTDTIVIDERGCDCFAILGNAFTPNNDGINDRFMPKASPDCMPVKNFAFRIYDRWGQQVYASYTTTDKGWDGTFHNKPADAGTYFYELKFVGGEEATEVYKKGDLTLVR